MVRCLPSISGEAAAGEISSIYATHLGTITITWSRGSLGVFLQTDLCLSPVDGEAKIADHLRIRLRPYLSWKRRGSKHHHFVSASGRRRVVELSWDLTLASFSRRGGPEPMDGFFLSFAVDGEMALIVGDHPASELVSRRERVRFGGIGGGAMTYSTKGTVEISISIDLEEEEMEVRVKGEKVLEVRRLGWKFRGSEGLMLKGGGRLQVSWDLYDWLFRPEVGAERSPAAAGDAGEAVFVLSFESNAKDRLGSFSDEDLDCCHHTVRRSSGDRGFTLVVCGRKD